MPCLITFLLFCKRMIVDAGARMKGDYLKELEDHFYYEEGVISKRRTKFGWEGRLRTAWKERWLSHGWSHVVLFWIATWLGTLIMPFVFLAKMQK